MTTIIYFILVFFATSIGALTGLGGGIIIKPMMDMLGQYNPSTINVLSSFTVFAMALVSITKQIKNGNKVLPYIAINLSIGSVLGGMAGSKAFDIFVRLIGSDKLCTAIQSLLLIIILTLTLIYNRKSDSVKGYHLKNFIGIIAVGFSLGLVSSFLGIGGGPFNIAVICILFSMTIKQAVIHSIITILFSQLFKIGDVIFIGDITSYNLDILPIMIIAAVFGGYLGSVWSKKLSEEQTKKLYEIVIILVIAISLWNSL